MSKKTNQAVNKENAVNTTETQASGIIVNDVAANIAQVALTVVLPDDANSAQVEFAKFLNSFASQNPKGWELKKERLLKELVSLKTNPVLPIDNSKTIVGSPVPSATLSE
jgi:hypothetical protein